MDVDTDPDANNDEFENDDDDFGDDGDDWDDDDGGDGWGDGELTEIDPATMMSQKQIDITQPAPKTENGTNNNNNNNDNNNGTKSQSIEMKTNNNDQISGVSAVQHQIPQVTVNALNNNCTEINMIPMFVAKADLKSRSRIGALIGIRINHLFNLTHEQLEVWGIDKNKYKFIVLKFEFGTFYLNEGQPPTVNVGLSQNLVWEEPLQEFRLSWTMAERVKTSYTSNQFWRPGNINLNSIPDAAKINDLMESTQQEYALCLQALKDTKFDGDSALNLMFDDSQVKRLKKKLISTKESQLEFETILGKVWNRNDGMASSLINEEEKKESIVKAYENANDSTKISQLSEMFGIPLTVAKFAYDTHGYDQAVAKLTDQTEKQSVIAMAQSLEDSKKTTANASLDKVSDFFQSYSNQDENNNNKNKDNLNSNNNGIGGKVKNWWSKSKDNNNANNDNDNSSNNNNNNNNTFADSDEKFLDVVGTIKRTQSDNRVQQCKREDIMRTIATMSKHNWLLQVLCFAFKVLLNGNKFCMICDKPLVFAGLKPSICDKPFCQFRHDEMELGFSLADEIVNRPALVDLLISMCYAACKANRYQDFFPKGVRADTITNNGNINNDDTAMKSNTSIDPLADNDTTNINNVNNNNNNTSTIGSISGINNTSAWGSDFREMDSFMTGGTADASKVIAVIDMCPEVSELKIWAEKGKKYLKQKCWEIHPLLYHFLSWVITSNRSHLKLLKENERIKEVDTEWQFALCSSTPQREAEFQQLQHNNGSFLSWHGSGFGNWHSILRMGLKNYSGTKNQSNGAAYGPGIYLAANFSYSWAYCNRGNVQAWSKSQYGSSVNCMALCEVCYHSQDAHKHKNKLKNSASAVNINKTNSIKTQPTSITSKSVKNTTNNATSNTNSYTSRYRQGDANNKWLKTNGIYVVDQEEHVITRFFFIFPNTGYNSHGKSQEANSLKIPQVVKTFD